MTSEELRERFLDFFEKRGHKIVPSSSLIPTDPSVLFTTAGMQQFIPYLSGEKDVLKYFKSRHLCSVQKCFRSNDIDWVGDDTHHTFFEMLGNWSVGEDEKGYFKEGAINLAIDFLTKTLGLEKSKFNITIFKGDKEIKKDEESFNIWKKNGIPEKRIYQFGMEDNFWGPVSETGPCGPCSEIHYDRGEKYGCREKCGPNCRKCERFVEIWNLVFMEYNKKEEGVFERLPQRNVDTGIGFERLIAVLEKKSSAYETDLFSPIIQGIEKGRGAASPSQKLKAERIIADHIRGSVFLISEGILPSNIERGYILRRVLRRAIRYGKLLNSPKNFLIPLAQKVIEIYKDIYPEVKSKETEILTVIQNEEEKFAKTLEDGLKIFEKYYQEGKFATSAPGIVAFDLFQSYGFPLELTQELIKERGQEVNFESFKEAFEKHREVSRAGLEKKFGGIGKEATYTATKLHTATHLLHAALREVLGKQVKQMGSDITPQRLRFDFSHHKKMTEEEIKQVQELVNQKIKEDLKVKKEEMSYQKAIKTGALAFFKEKYPEVVTVYSINNWSKEICAGPHVGRTSELGVFEIIKEESCGAGVRRIRAILRKK